MDTQTDQAKTSSSNEQITTVEEVQGDSTAEASNMTKVEPYVASTVRSPAIDTGQEPTVSLDLHDSRAVRFQLSVPAQQDHANKSDHADSSDHRAEMAGANGTNVKIVTSSGNMVNTVVPSTFYRSDSIIFRVKPGQSFTELANVLVESPTISDPRLGTLGELRHHLRTGTKSQVKKFLRNNPWSCGHRIRAELWKELCRDGSTDAQRGVYREFLVTLGNMQTNPAFLSAPGVVVCDHQLKESGRACLLRLLTAIEHQRPDFTYIPVLYPLCALFLHYMNEEEAFACVMSLLSQSQKFLIQTDIANAASKRTLVVLLKKHVNRAYVFMQKLASVQDDKDLVQVFDEWKFWVFRDLPFSHLVRVVDCFLFEGQKVLFRVALAVVHLWYKARYKELRHKSDWTSRQITNDICDFCRGLKIQPQKLLKAAFGIRNLKMSTIIRLQQKHELNLRQCNSSLAQLASTQNLKQLLAPHRFIEVRLSSNLLSHTQAMQLYSWLPSRYQLFTPTRLFSTDEDGRSFTRLWSKIEDYYPTIIVIQTSKGEIIGAFCSTSWSTRRRHSAFSYFGTGETFLFRFTNEGEKFAWVGAKKSSVGHSEELFQAADPTTLIVGGGTNEGLSIRQSLECGSSQRCDTFDNPPLATSDCDFEVRVLEVFGFTAEE